MEKSSMRSSVKDNKIPRWWWKKIGTDTKFPVLLFILAVFILGLLLYLIIKLVVPSKPCMSAECLIAAADIARYIDPWVDPCEDFYKFACGRYIKSSSWDKNADIVNKLHDQLTQQLDEIMNEPIRDDENYLVKTQKALLQSCLNETATKEESLGVIKEMLDELHGWPVVVGYTWNETLFDWTDVIIKLRRMGYPFAMILSFTPYIEENSKDRILNIQPPRVYLPADEHKEQYKRYISEVAVAFGADQERAEIEMEKVMDFADRLKKITSITMSNEESNATEILTIEELQTHNDEIDWLNFINNITHPVVKVYNDTRVRLPSDEVLSKIFRLMSKTPKRIQANYIFWFIIKAMMNYMPGKIKKSKEKFLIETGASICGKKWFQMCKDEINDLFLPVPSDILYVRKYLSMEKREKVHSLFNSIKSEFVALLKESSWMDAESKEKAIEKIETIVGVIGSFNNYSDDAEFEKYEVGKKVFKMDSFLKMFLNRKRDQVDAIYDTIENPRNDTFTIKMFQLLIAKVNAFYSQSLILITASILQGIIYDENRPMYLNYGAIGSIMGHELTHAIARTHNRENLPDDDPVWTEETREVYLERTKCIVQAAEDSIDKLNGTLTLDENIADYTGLKLAYTAYKSWVRDNGEEETLVGINYSPYQLFWISTTMLYCYKADEKIFEKDRHARNTFRAIEPIRNNEDFVRDFKCSLESKMNPIEKCQIF